MTQLAAKPTRWEPLRDQQKAAVVDAVVNLVSSGTAVTVAELAELAGMSRPTFYKYFPTLGAAMLHTHRVLLSEMRDYVDARLPDASTPARDRLLASFDIRFNYTRAHPHVLRFFTYFDFTFRRHGLTEEEQAQLSEIVDNSGDHSRELFAEGQADGSIRASLPPEPTIMALSGSLAGLAERLMIQDEYSRGDDSRARAAHELVLEGWRSTLA